MAPQIRPNSFAARALKYIEANPGCKFVDVHEAIRPGVASMAGTSRDTCRLERDGLIAKQRDGQCVRHYPTQEQQP